MAQCPRISWAYAYLGVVFATICDRLWQKQAFGEKISFADFSLELINNNF